MATQPSKCWRDVIKVHPAADLFPMMSPDELRVLGEDIKKHGLTSPIVLLHDKGEDGYSRYSLLDGRNRLDAMELAGLPLPPLEVDSDAHRDSRVKVESATKISLKTGEEVAGVDPYEYVISANIHRRHLTAEQKRELVEKLIKADPQKSNRQVAAMATVSHPTVAKIRDELEAKGDVEKVTTSTDTLGRKQPTHRPPPPTRRPTHPPVSHSPATDTAAIVRRFGSGMVVSVKAVAANLRGGVAATYVAKLLEKLSAEPYDGYRAERVEGSGNDATWRIAPVEAEATFRKLSALKLPTEPADSEPGLSPTAQQKLEAAIRAHKNNLDREFDARVQAEAKRQVEERSIPAFLRQVEDFKRLLAAHRVGKGLISKADFNAILSCLHPDSIASRTPEQLAKAFQIFNGLKPKLVDAEEELRLKRIRKNAEALPETREELLARRKVKTPLAEKSSAGSTVAE